MPTLFDPIQLGDIDLASRIVMAPLTRNRAGAGQVPTELMVQYYAQRANPATGAGLLITEGKISWLGEIAPLQPDYDILHAEGLVVCPGLIDLHCHLRQPGFEEKALEAVKKLGSKRAKLYLELRVAFQERGDYEALEQAKALLQESQSLSMADGSTINWILGNDICALKC